MSRHGLYRDSLVSAVAERDCGTERLSQIISILQGGDGSELSAIVSTVLTCGFDHPSPAGPTLSFAGLCRVHHNPGALRTMVEAGAPEGHSLHGAGRKAWVDHLCSWKNARGHGASNLYSIAVEPVIRCSRAFLEIAHEADPTHPWLIGSSENSPNPSFLPPRGTLHYELLWKALSGEGADLQKAATLARQVRPAYPAGPYDAKDRLAAALDCLEFMRSVRAPCSPFPALGEPLDAAPFALAYGAGRRKDVVGPLLEAYVEAGLLDVRRKLSRHYPDVGGATALEAAIWGRNAAAAVSLVELGAQIDLPLPDAIDETTAPVVAQVTEALMRRQLAEHVRRADVPSTAPRRRAAL